jgi:hypothetical protein
MKKTNPQPSGIALLVTLAFVVMISIIIVGFAVSMRTDRPAAKSHLEKTRARFLAQRGADEVLATLRKTTEDPERNWVSQPGQLVAGAAADDPATPIDDRKVLAAVVPLSSGLSTATPADPVYQAPNFNVPTLRDPGTCLITDRLTDPANPGSSKIKMPVKWIYVRKDGTTDTNELPPSLNTSNSTNPIVGRYAYWSDDESGKVNYNLAWGRGATNTNPPAHPSKIDLTALTNLTQPMADAIHAFITSDINYGNIPLHFFNTPEEARQIELQPFGPGAAAALAANKFELTHYNHDPNTTFFNEPRIVLTTRPDRAGWTKATSGTYNGQWVGTNGKPGKEGTPYYIRIIKDIKEGKDGLADSGDGPAPIGNLDSGKVSDTINNLTSYMQRTDWPMVAGSSSLQDKYFSAYPASIRATRLAQIAINIIDYVRCKEAAPYSPTGQDYQGMVQPLRVESNVLTPPTFTVKDAPTNYSLSYFGQTRAPLITEVGVWLSPDFKTMTFKVELYLPENYGLNQVDVSKLYLSTEAPGFAIESSAPKILATEVSNPILTKGNYTVITHTRTTATTTLVTRPPSAFVRIAIALNGSAARLDVVPAFSAYKISCPVDPVGVAPGAITSMEVDDPRVNKHPDDWKRRASGNSFGSANSISALKGPKAADPAKSPQQDTDAGGNLSTASLYMPPPAGSPNNLLGMVTSAGELGYIHTGVECSPKTPATPLPQVDLPAGTPWRSMRLQPNSQATSVVPDWAFMDLFTSPLSVSPNAKYVYNPRDTAIGGRVNVNAKVEPFGLDRILPLAAVLQGCGNDSTNSSSKVTAAQALTLAGNIYRRVLADGNPKGKSYGYGSGYDSAGEIVEIKGIADGGEQSEALYREISNLVTARGNVFSIYAIGQAIEQTPDGRLLVTAEQRTRTIAERFLNPANNKIEFGSVYFRSLNQ